MRKVSEQAYKAIIASAVEKDHACNDPHCDIRAAMEADCPLSAAHLLQGATECPHVDAAIKEYGPIPRIDGANGEEYGDCPTDWPEWKAYHNEHGVQCVKCGAFNYYDDESGAQCGNCLALLPMIRHNIMKEYLSTTGAEKYS